MKLLHTQSPQILHQPPQDTKVCTIKEGDNVTLKIASQTPITINDVQIFKNNQPIITMIMKHENIFKLNNMGNKDVRLNITRRTSQ